MNSFTRSTWLVLLLAFAGELSLADETFRVLSWNISENSFASKQQVFQSALISADPDVVLFDEVAPSSNTDELMSSLVALRPGNERWHMNFGTSGGRQRGIIASRYPLEPLPGFSSIVPYPDDDRRRILDGMSPRERARPAYFMDGGIPVNGAIILIGERRLLAVIADLQCCGDGPDSWQEFRRRVEAREIRRVIREVLERTPVDGIIFAGDFNLVGSTFPMALLTGPYSLPNAGLIPAEIYHRDGETTWTWDGRGTPFPSNTLDYQLYGPLGLELRSGIILDAEDLKQIGEHRPLIVEYGWH